MTRTVLLVRHGDTTANAGTPGPELERGWKPYPLDDAGRKEARKTAQKLVSRGVKVLISSDLERAKESAKIIGDLLGIEPQFHSQLRTWNTGELAGKPKSEVEPEIGKLVRFAPDRIIPGGESFDQFCRRIFAAMSDILATHSRDPIAVIIHGRIERLLEAWDGKRDHKINTDTFLAKPEKPGHIEMWGVDPAALKLSHDEVDFERAEKTKGDRCGICKAYGGRNKCTKVLPPMDDDDWCAVGVAKSDGRWFCPVKEN